jgi:hypothetical protein
MGGGVVGAGVTIKAAAAGDGTDLLPGQRNAGVDANTLLRHIFIVDDDDMVRSVLQRFLLLFKVNIHRCILLLQVFENQRFKPGRGWGNRTHGLGGNLLPTDRGAFSDRCGANWSTYAFKDKILSYLELDAMEYNDASVEGGWRYAVDFPAFDGMTSEAAMARVEEERWTSSGRSDSEEKHSITGLHIREKVKAMGSKLKDAAMLVRRRAWVKKKNRWGERQVKVLDGLQTVLQEMDSLQEVMCP